jgi:GTP pyrophosphokinase
MVQRTVENNNAIETPIIDQATALARLAGEGNATPEGVSCYQQGLEIQQMLSSVTNDPITIAAATLLSCVQHADLDYEDVNDNLGEKVSQLIKHTIELDTISELYAAASSANQHAKIDKIRKMLLAMVKDVRAVLIKLTERLIVLAHIKLQSESKKQAMAAETMAIYAPLANRLGLGQIKWELEDLSFRYLEPEKYKEISKSLKQRRIDRDKYVKTFVKDLNKLLANAGIKQMNVYGRSKHIYSIYRKMQRKNVDFEEIYDATAVRILLDTVEDCYTALSHVHATWPHIAKEFDDYIATPKPNGYQSIHTAVIGPENRSVEIQIRTKQMHEDAELGVAAHWVYKEGPQKHSDYETKIAWLRQVMDWQQEVTQSEDKLNEVNKIFEDRVYVFTPNGDIIDLPQGATPLDFAYQIHSEIGHRCRGAKINGKIVQLTYQLQTGDQVDIITTKIGAPSRDWLNPHLGFIITSRAKSKIHAWFKKQDYDKNVELGQNILDREFKRLGLRNININNIASQFNYKNSDDFFAAIAVGYIKLGSIINQISLEQKNDEEQLVGKIETKASKVKPTDIKISGVGNLLTHIANCCHPIPGDPIIGYITQGRGVSIHRQDCPNVIHANPSQQDRLIEVSWGTKTATGYPVDLVIAAYDRPGLIKDISNIIANEKISLVGLNTTTDKSEGMAYTSLTIEINNLDALSKITNKINQLTNVIEVKRKT